MAKTLEDLGVSDVALYSRPGGTSVHFVDAAGGKQKAYLGHNIDSAQVVEAISDRIEQIKQVDALAQTMDAQSSVDVWSSLRAHGLNYLGTEAQDETDG